MENLDIEKTFAIAIENHKKNNLTVAIDFYNKILKVEPNYFTALNNLGVIFQNTNEYQKAINCYEKVIEVNPNFCNAYFNLGVIFYTLKDHQKAKNYYEKAIEIDPNHSGAYNNLGIIFYISGDIQKAKDCYEKAIEINSSYADAHNNLGIAFNKLGNASKAKDCYEKAIEINPSYADAHNNLGTIYKESGDTQKAKINFEKAIKIKPNYAEAHNNLGTLFSDLSDGPKAKESYEKAIKVNPNYTLAYWNLHSLTSDIDDSLIILKKLHEIDNKHILAKIMISVLEGYKGNLNMFNELLTSSNSSHPYIRSAKWIFSLPKLPKIFFNRSDFFNAVIELSLKSRPFYEFGVWNGHSFQYLINTFKKGFGFDTFIGIPEAWHNEPKGSYSSFGLVPEIEGGEFIVGKFEDTLPGFFSKERPMASLINFDADLYSSTLCALNYSNKVIDDKTILVFDELIINDNWEEDEFKALNEFCDNLNISYEVIAVSFFTKQVAVKLVKKS